MAEIWNAEDMLLSEKHFKNMIGIGVFLNFQSAS